MRIFFLFLLCLLPCLGQGKTALELSLLKVAEKENGKNAAALCGISFRELALSKQSTAVLFCDTPLFHSGLEWHVTPNLTAGSKDLTLASDLRWSLPEKGVFSGTAEENGSNAFVSTSRHTIRKGKTCYSSLIRTGSGKRFIPAVRGSFAEDPVLPKGIVSALMAELVTVNPAYHMTRQLFTVPLFHGKGCTNRTMTDENGLKTGYRIAVEGADTGIMKLSLYAAAYAGKRTDGRPMIEGCEAELHLIPSSDGKFHEAVSFLSHCSDARFLFSGTGSGRTQKIFRYKLIFKEKQK